MKKKIVITGFLALLLCLMGCEPDQKAQESKDNEPQLKLDGKSVLLYPVAVDVSGKSETYSFDSGMATVIGMFLERGGMNPEISNDSMPVTPADSLATIEDKINQFQNGRNIGADYTLFVTFRGKATETGRILDKTCIVITDSDGKTIWSREDTKFPDGPPDCPMTACVHVARSLRSVSDLQDFENNDAPHTTKMEELIAASSDVPPQEEFEAMKKRWEAARSNISEATITIYPFHVWGRQDGSMESAEVLAKRINESGLGRASVAKTDPQLDIKGNTNEAKVLWETARAFQSYLRENPGDTDYALLVDAGSGPRVSHVHMILCEGKGEWVMVDLQNSHQPDFQQVNPDSLEDCESLAALRWQKRVQNTE